MGLVCIQNSSLLVYSKSQKVSASYCLPFRHSRGKNQPVGGFRPPPPGLFRVNEDIIAQRFRSYIQFDCEGYTLSDTFYRIEIELLVSKLCPVLFG